MSSTGPVCLSPESLLKLVRAQSRDAAKLQRAIAELADTLRRFRRNLDQLEDFLCLGRVPVPRPAGRARFLIEGRAVPLAPTLAKVLLALAGDRNPRKDGGWQSVDDITARVSLGSKNPASRRSIIQAVYRLRKEFALAGLPDGLIATDGAGRWRLTVSSIGLPNPRETHGDLG